MEKLLTGIVFSLFLTSNVFSLEIDFSCPKSVYVGEEFECSLQAKNFTGVYDAKVDISADGKNIAEVWDEGWKSAYYYLYGFVDDEDEKKIRLKIVEDFKGEIEGILKLRKDSKREFFNFGIEIKSSEKNSESEVEESNNEGKGDIKEKIEEIEKTIEPENYSEVKEVINLEKSNKENSKSENITSFNEVLYESKNEQIKKYSVFGFALLCLMLSVLIILKKLD